MDGDCSYTREGEETWNEGKAPVPFRNVLDGILYVLRTGCHWNALPKEYGSGSTAHRGFQKWVGEGVFDKIWVRLLKRYDDVRGIRL